ncbi:NADP-dependent oxidoreductase [Agrococcus jejuensis]|uniref:NADPH:quinone reductase n=1 Tax=Agrococcus jejuensis TaxID=399736 RepID=A0A1G8D582_9MICO|nr:NADP-dependent oxidoreductase [Agrococcus jejuensis]SDH52862.1 NADPH:quinone reductase [Agrococcus jejuensis]
MSEQTMQAVVYDEFGGPEQLVLREVAAPTPGPGEVRIRVKRAGVNPVDWKVLGGGLRGLIPHVLPIVPGWDVAGVVDALGPDVPELAVGDEVLSYARKDWVQQGTFAELVTVRVVDVARKPEGLSWDAAGALPLAGLTAERVLDAAGVSLGSTVLVHGASGGVGTLAVQLARLRGARVIGTASLSGHDRLRALGAEPVAYGDGLVDAVRALAPEGVDAVVDLVGGVMQQTLAVLAEGGRHASIADHAAGEHGGRWVWVRPDGPRLETLAQRVADGELDVEIAGSFPLADVAGAFAQSMSGTTRGKLVIHVAD